MLKTMIRATLFAAACGLSFAVLARADEVKRVDVPAGDLTLALEVLAKQSGVELIYQSDQVRGLSTGGATGEMTAVDAVTKLLHGTPLTLMRDQAGAFVIVSTGVGITSDDGSNYSTSALTRAAALQIVEVEDSRGASVSGVGQIGTNQRGRRSDQQEEQPAGGGSAEQKSDAISTRLPQVLVRGGKVLNTDIARTRDDAQPYVVFERSVIEKSGVDDLDDFLKQRLTMNTIGVSNAQLNTTLGSASTINLRGLGANQTLILIDGRRPAPINAGSGSYRQADLNGIPLAAVERIEILPSTASGIYGGGATGGVVNVILRRDYVGAEARIRFENTFDSDVTGKSVDLSAGLSSADERTTVLFAASYSDSNMLLVDERSFFADGRAAIVANGGGDPQILNLGEVVPPGGSTTNIRSLDGSDLTLRDGTLLGSPITNVPIGYAGPATDGGLGMVGNAGTYNLNSARTAQNGFGGQQSLLGQPTRASGMLTLRRKFTPSVEAFLDFGASEVTTKYRANYLRQDYFLPASAATNPFNQDVVLSVPLPFDHSDQTSNLEELRAVGGLIWRLPRNWQAAADYTWSRSRNTFSAPGARLPTLAGDIFNGVIDVLRDPDEYAFDVAGYAGPDQEVTPQELELKDAVMRFAGPVGSMPGGDVVLSTSLSHREEDMSESFFNNIIPNFSFFFPAQALTSDAVYAEIALPFVSEVNSRPGVYELSLQMAGRYEKYELNSATGSVLVGSGGVVRRSTSRKDSTDPTVALRYRPVSGFALRASYATGFLPPTFAQVLSTPTPVPFNVVDPLRGNTIYPVPTGPGSIQGGNPNVEPESSESVSVGFIVEPRRLEGLRVSVDWTRIDKTDNIVNIGQQGIVNREASFPGRVTRGANLPGDPPEWAGPITAIDATVVNLAEAFVEAWDFAIDYTLNTDNAGTFDFYLLATRQTDLERKILPTDAFVEQVGVTASNPLKLRGNFGLNWTRGNWTLGWSSTYFDSYFVADPSVSASDPVFVQQGSRKVDSQHYHDVFGVYRRDEASGGRLSNLLDDTEIQVGIRNLFNERPPLDASRTELYSPFGDPRMASYYASVTRRF